MITLLALCTGFILAIMITLNGQLTQTYNMFLAIVIIHVVGVLFALCLCLIKKIKLDLFYVKPRWLYLGGAIGVFTTIANNISFGQISMTSIIALGLFGQLMISVVVDTFGLFKMEKRSFKKSNLVILIFALLGILMMLDNSVWQGKVAVFMSIAAGVSVVMNRTVNAQLAQHIGDLPSSLVNHLVGLPITIIILFFVYQMRWVPLNYSLSLNPLIYLGGALGVITVVLSNITVYKIPAFKLTVLVFVSQLFTGICVDLLFGLNIDNASFMGGIVVALGIVIGLIIERVIKEKERKEEERKLRLKRLEEIHFERVYKKFK